jgi:hypothetical protein
MVKIRTTGAKKQCCADRQKLPPYVIVSTGVFTTYGTGVAGSVICRIMAIFLKDLGGGFRV